MVDGPAHGIQQGGAAPDKVFLFRQGGHPIQRHPVVDDLCFVVKQHRGDERLARLPPLLLEHGVKAADGVPFQPRHGAAAIENEYQFRQILFHKKYLLYCGVFYLHP